MSPSANTIGAEHKQEKEGGAYECDFCKDAKIVETLTEVSFGYEVGKGPCPECALEDSKEIY